MTVTTKLESPDFTRRWVRLLGAGLCAWQACACAGSAVSTQRVERLYSSIDLVTRAGAYACAPRELALARAHYDFAQIEISQGNLGRARDHLVEAEENAGAAQILTPDRGCAMPAAAAESMPSVPPAAASASAAPSSADPGACSDATSEADGCRPGAASLTPKRPADETHTDAVSSAVDTSAVQSGTAPSCSDAAADGTCPTRLYPNVTITEHALELSVPIAFSGESDELRPTSHALLDVVAQLLIEQPSMRLEIAGHTDGRGDAVRNLSLSQQQADSVRRYLIERGVAGSRLTAQGYGETRPIESNSTSRGRAINRRIELIRSDRCP